MSFKNASADESNAAVEKVCQIVSEMAGIQLGQKQYSMVQSRLQTRMLFLQMQTYSEYMMHLFKNLDTETLALVSLMTTHYTYFFREFNHFEFLLNKSLPQLIQSARSRTDKTIHIWSAACSSGEEGYSLALFFHFHLSEIAPDLKFKVYGTDIDPESVQKAKNAVYKNEELTQSPTMYIRDQFVKGQGSAEGFAKVKKHLKDVCDFSVLNLFDAESYKPEIQFDIIFCRNVFIYFEIDQVKQLSKFLLKRLHPNGTFFTGISESLTRFGLDINTLGTSIYQHKSAQKLTAISRDKNLKSATVAPELKKAQPLQLLCVDDSPTILNLMKKILTLENGFIVKATAKNGLEALDLLKTQNFDAITLDLHMPQMDGLEFLRQFNHSVPVLMISSVNRDDISLAQKALASGASDYVEKPSLNNLVQAGNEIGAKLKMIHRNFKKPVQLEKTIKNEQPAVLNSNVLQKKIKVLIVDDSLTVLNLLSKMISTNSGIEVVATTTKPLETEMLIEKFKPDVITMDIHMPDLDGLELLKIVKAKFKIPTIMISSLTKEDSDLVLKAMQLGAVDFIQKPNLAQVKEMTEATCERIFAAAKTKVKNGAINLENVDADYLAKMNHKIILLGASTGGTEAIKELLIKLPPQIPPILIVQHIPEFFSAGFAKHLDDILPFKVKEATQNDEVKPNQILIAPGGKQMAINFKAGRYFVDIKNDLPMNRHKPSVDYLFKSALQNQIPTEKLIAVILTGMGADGAAEMKNLHNLGVKTIAQSEESCVVFGMPKEAIKLGAIDYVLPLEQIAQKIIELSTTSISKLKKVS